MATFLSIDLDLIVSPSWAGFPGHRGISRIYNVPGYVGVLPFPLGNPFLKRPGNTAYRHPSTKWPPGVGSPATSPLDGGAPHPHRAPWPPRSGSFPEPRPLLPDI